MKSSNAERRRSLPLLSATAFAKLLDVAPSTVSNWIHEGMPVRSAVRSGRAARISIGDAMPWVLRRRRTVESQQGRLFMARAESVEYENAETRRNRVRSADLAEALASMAARLEQLHLEVASEIAPAVANIDEPALVRGHLLTAMWALRTAFADWLVTHTATLAGAGIKRMAGATK